MSEKQHGNRHGAFLALKGGGTYEDKNGNLVTVRPFKEDVREIKGELQKRLGIVHRKGRQFVGKKYAEKRGRKSVTESSEGNWRFSTDEGQPFKGDCKPDCIKNC